MSEDRRAARFKRRALREPGGGSAGRTLARLVRYYHLDPMRVGELPIWVLQILINQMPALQAEELMIMAQASSLPHVKRSQRGGVLRRLKRTIKRGLSRISGDEPEQRRIERHDPEAARQWAEERGIKFERRTD